MVTFVLKRIGVGVGLVYVVVTLIFLAIHAVPGDPAQVLASGGTTGTATPEAVEKLREQLGNLGESFRDGRGVLAIIGERLPNTLELVLLACTIGAVLGILLGALAARRGGWVDALITGFSSLAIATPVYVLGTVFVLFLSLQLGLFPAGGFSSWEDGAGRHIQMLLLPAITLSLSFIAVVARMTRASVLETQQMDWVRTATSWGLSPDRVFRRYVLRNSLTPVTTAIGLEVGTMLGSTVLAERVFNYPGLSALLVDAVVSRDYPVVQGIVIVISVLFIAINILVDVLYRVLDPRVG
jgi:peptide/nickel transport system permease protein